MSNRTVHACQAANQRVAGGHMGPLWPTILKPEQDDAGQGVWVIYGCPPD